MPFIVLSVAEERALLIRERSDILAWLADPRQSCSPEYADRVLFLRRLKERLDWLAQIGD